MTDTIKIERKSGIAMWRQIADAIRQQLNSDLIGQDGKLPTEKVLAERFDVNRHTIRAAIAALISEGLLRSEQGRGTFVEKRQRLVYPISKRTRFSAGLEGQAQTRRSKLLEHSVEKADQKVASHLNIELGAQVIHLETLSTADESPISTASHWFSADRFNGAPEAFAEKVASLGSITKALGAFGIEDYTRAFTELEARHGNAQELARLHLSPGAIILASTSLNVDAEGEPIQFSMSRFAADRVTLKV